MMIRPKLFFFIVFAALALSVSGQETRPVIVVGSKSPTPTPPKTPGATVTPTPPKTPGASVTPTPMPSPTPVQVRQTLFDLQARIRTILARPEIARASVGVKIALLDTGAVLFDQNSEKYFVPASNMKSFTVAAALERLSPDFRFTTSVYAGARPDQVGVVKGPLTILGRGDVSFSNAFNANNFFAGLDALADRIYQSGVRRVDGDLITDETYFSGSALPVGWEWDDLQWYSGAEVSAFPLNDNVVGLSVRPTKPGQPCLVAMEPINPVYQVMNTCVTSASGTRPDLSVKKALDRNILEISGSLPAGGNGFSDPVTVSRPAEMFAALLKQRLELKGVVVTGRSRAMNAREKSATLSPVAQPVSQVEIAKLDSPPLSLIAQNTLKPSQNMYTETILWTLGEQGRGYPVSLKLARPEDNPYSNPKSTSAERGAFVVRNFVNQIGIPADAIVQQDGSGLSRHNLVTPAALVQLYTYMATRSRFATVWNAALPIGGVDGTLKNRFRDPRTTGNVRGKTGTLDQVSALSGYLTTAAGQRVVFSVIVNEGPRPAQRTAVIDEIVTAVAAYDGNL